MDGCLPSQVRQVSGSFPKASRKGGSNPSAGSSLDPETSDIFPRNPFLVRNQLSDKRLIIGDYFFFFFFDTNTAFSFRAETKKENVLGPRTYITINKNSQLFAAQSVQGLSMVQILGGQLIFNHVIHKQILHPGVNVRGSICKRRAGRSRGVLWK